VGAYIQSAVSADRLANGRAARARVAQLSAIEARYGVPADILLGVWGMETAYGRIKGDQDVIRSLATLAAQGADAAGPKPS
jgi:membrane-bound lytic murein transglycosylase B